MLGARLLPTVLVAGLLLTLVASDVDATDRSVQPYTVAPSSTPLGDFRACRGEAPAALTQQLGNVGAACFAVPPGATRVAADAQLQGPLTGPQPQALYVRFFGPFNAALGQSDRHCGAVPDTAMPSGTVRIKVFVLDPVIGHATTQPVSPDPDLPPWNPANCSIFDDDDRVPGLVALQGTIGAAFS